LLVPKTFKVVLLNQVLPNKGFRQDSLNQGFRQVLHYLTTVYRPLVNPLLLVSHKLFKIILNGFPKFVKLLNRSFHARSLCRDKFKLLCLCLVRCKSLFHVRFA